MLNELKKKILEKYLELSEKSHTTNAWHHTIADELTENEEERAQIITECGFLQDDGYLEKIIIDAFGKNIPIGIRITAKGRKALQTIYDPEWVNQNNKEKRDEKKLKEREIKNAENNYKWTKIGVIGAIVLGIVSIIYTAFKP